MPPHVSRLATEGSSGAKMTFNKQLRSSAVTDRSYSYDFLLVFHSNSICSLYCFQYCV